MFRSILVPVDGSTLGEHALPWALGIARRAGASVQLVHVHRPLEATYAEMQIFDDTLDSQMRDQEQAYLDNLVSTMKAASPVSVTAVKIDGDVASSLRAHAAKTGADLIVMTTHARGPMGRFWLGSVTDELLRESSIPMLLIHPHDKPANFSREPAFRHVLIPLSGEPMAEQIFSPATALAKLMQAELTLVRVVRPVVPVDLPAGPATFGAMASSMMERVEGLHTQLKKEAYDYLEKVAAPLRSDGFQVEVRVAIEEQPGVAILAQAKEPIDLIALETHGRRGLSRLFLGSVADKVVRGAHVPVLVHRPAH